MEEKSASHSELRKASNGKQNPPVVKSKISPAKGHKSHILTPKVPIRRTTGHFWKTLHMKLCTLQAHCTVDPKTKSEGENRVESLCYTINFQQHWFVPLKFIQFSCEEHFPINSWSEGNTFLVHIHIPCVHRRIYLSRQIKLNSSYK